MTRPPPSVHAHIHCLDRIIFEQITWQKVELPRVKLLSDETVKCSKPIQWRKFLKIEIEIEKRRKVAKNKWSLWKWKKKRCEIESKKEMLFLVSKLNTIYKLLLSQQYKI